MRIQGLISVLLALPALGFCGNPASDPILAEFRRLPGSVSLTLARLEPEPKEIFSINPDSSLGIGSAFKLYILAALAEAKIDWSDVVVLQPRLRSLPSGLLNRWPDGAPATIFGLAAEMISRSDNTATDHLLEYVGRAKVEKLVGQTGHQNPPQNKPFLSTSELFKLKRDSQLRAEYLSADEPGRRTLLDTRVSRISTDGLLDWAKENWSSPIAIEQLEWFASSRDLCRLMDWLLSKGDKTVLEILAINPGIDLSRRFSYIGFKGGSEPGVLNLTFLLRAKTGEVYAFSAGWNDPSAPVDEQRFIELVSKLLGLETEMLTGALAGRF